MLLRNAFYPADLEGMSAQDRVRWVLNRYDRVIVSTSFQCLVTAHIASQIKPDIQFVFIDTQYLHPETYAFARETTERLNLNVRIYRALRSAACQEEWHGKRWEQGDAGINAYNLENKVEPMNRAVQDLGATAWLAGLRREQNEHRSTLPVFEMQRSIAKIYPIIDWTSRDVHFYLKEHGLPDHPLADKYDKIGDVHSSITWEMSQDRRECGLHDLSERPKGFNI